jgi:hypothetical protein
MKTETKWFIIVFLAFLILIGIVTGGHCNPGKHLAWETYDGTVWNTWNQEKKAWYIGGWFGGVSIMISEMEYQLDVNVIDEMYLGYYREAKESVELIVKHLDFIYSQEAFLDVPIRAVLFFKNDLLLFLLNPGPDKAQKEEHIFEYYVDPIKL